MNIEELILQIKKRPGMYVGCNELEPIIHFINGFMFNNFITKKVDILEKTFRENFHNWVKDFLENEYNIKLENNRNYYFYITQISQNLEEQINIFFRLCDIFFTEFHYKNNV